MDHTLRNVNSKEIEAKLLCLIVGAVKLRAIRNDEQFNWFK
jgi:hypothetical protein